ncbi:MAG: S1C family serine protease [Burkholderiaceae bacterium]
MAHNAGLFDDPFDRSDNSSRMGQSRTLKGMSEQQKWAFPKAMQPDKSEVEFDLSAALDAVVLVRSEIPEDGFTAETLGTERVGNGVCISEDGLVLTIGYLVTEAQSVWLTCNDGSVVAGYPIAYDQVTGFGLIKALGPLSAPPLPRSTSQDVQAGDTVYVIGQGGIAHALKSQITDKHEFAGYWEYLLDEALFTSPAHPQWGGAAVLNEQGQLIGIGSLLVQEGDADDDDDEAAQANMIVPIELLEPILDDLVTTGQAARAPRPWLGLYPIEAERHLVVGGVANDGPAARAGLSQGDLILAVGEQKVESLAWFFREVWQQGPAGTEIPLTVAQNNEISKIKILSADRNDYLKKPSLH